MISHQKLGSRQLLVGAGLTTSLFLGLWFLPTQANESSDLAQANEPTTALVTFDDDVRAILSLGNPNTADDSLEYLEANWQQEFVPMLLEVLVLIRQPSTLRGLVNLLETQTGETHGTDLNAWYNWLWSQPPLEHPDYPEFKAALYGLLDSRFTAYFNSNRPATIRLDEVRWGGVAQDGIPPLRNPEMITAAEADYLDDDNVIFGIAVNGDVRAYPQRILAWHEMFTDTVGEVPVTGVYCTLCGTMILYESELNGTLHDFGTSGFLYRSNKLMYDQATQSLWVTLLGQPVIGPLADQDLTLEYLSVVTSTWGEWKRRHPDTLVLSLNTGHQRDYGEGVAYQDYFATDDLMFGVPELDDRLNNKSEVLGLLFPEYTIQPLAISTTFLNQNPVYHDQLGDLEFVVVTDPSGANRVYESQGLKFETFDGDQQLTDAKGQNWDLTEDALINSEGEKLQRLPAYRSFWFGWYAAYGDTRLVN